MANFINLFPSTLEMYIPMLSTDEAVLLFEIYTLDDSKSPLIEGYIDSETELLELGNTICINLENITEIIINKKDDISYAIIFFINNIAKYKINIEYEIETENENENEINNKYNKILKDFCNILYSYYTTGIDKLDKISNLINKYKLDDDF